MREFDEDENNSRILCKIVTTILINLSLILVTLAIVYYHHEKKEKAQSNCPCYNYTSIINKLVSYENKTIMQTNEDTLKLNSLWYLACTSIPVCTIVNDFGTGIYASGQILNIGYTNVTGGLAIYPGSAITGFPPGLISGSIFTDPNPLALSISSAFFDYLGCLSGFRCTTILTSVVTTVTTYLPDSYCTDGNFQLSSNIILDGNGYDNPMWIFDIRGNFVVDAYITITIINTKNPCNIAWISQGGISISNNVNLEGSVFSNGNVQLGTSSIVTGRVVSFFGDVLMDTNLVNSRNCIGYKNCTLSPLKTIPYIPNDLINV